MSLLPQRAKAVLRDLVGSTIVALLFLGVAIGLSFLEDWCRDAHRPTYLLVTIEIISIAAIIGDGIIWLSLVYEGVKSALKKAFK